MDSCLTSPPKDTGEEEARAPSSPSLRKRRRWTARPLLLLVVRIAVPPVPPILLLPLLVPPPDPDLPCHLQETGEEDAKAPSSPSPRKRRQRTARRSSPLRCPGHRSLPPPPLLVPLLVPLLPPPPSAWMCVLLRVPRWVDCCVCFVSSVPPCAFHVALAVPLRHLPNCQIPGLLIQEVDC